MKEIPTDLPEDPVTVASPDQLPVDPWEDQGPRDCLADGKFVPDQDIQPLVGIAIGGGLIWGLYLLFTVDLPEYFAHGEDLFSSGECQLLFTVGATLGAMLFSWSRLRLGSGRLCRAAILTLVYFVTFGPATILFYYPFNWYFATGAEETKPLQMIRKTVEKNAKGVDGIYTLHLAEIQDASLIREVTVNQGFYDAVGEKERLLMQFRPGRLSGTYLVTIQSLANPDLQWRFSEEWPPSATP